MEKIASHFWEHKPLEKLTPCEWEALCDGCGLCCLNKIDCNGHTTSFLNTPCPHLDCTTCRCKVYGRRLRNGNCLKVDLALVRDNGDLLPDSCAYKRLYLGLPLPEWHPLISGNADSVYLAGHSVRSFPVIPPQLVELYPLQVLFTVEK